MSTEELANDAGNAVMRSLTRWFRPSLGVTAMVLLICAGVPPAAGQPSLKFHASGSEVRGKLIERYGHEGFALASETEHQVTFYKDFSNDPGMFAYLLFGDRTIQAYQPRVQFLFAPSDGGMEVRAAGEVIYQDGYGRLGRRVITQTPEFVRSVRTVLTSIRTELEGRQVDNLAPLPKIGEGRLTVVVDRATGEPVAFYAPSSPSKAKPFADFGSLKEFLISEAGTTEKDAAEMIARLKSDGRLSVSGLEWSREKLTALGLR